MRGLLTTALTAGALLVLPGAAMAAPDLTATITKDASTPGIDPASTVKYNVELNADEATTGPGVVDVSVNYTGDDAKITGGTVTNATTGVATTVTVDGTGVDINIPTGAFVGADNLIVQLDVVLPNRVVDIADGDTPFRLNVFEGGADATFNDTMLDVDGPDSDVWKGDGTKTSKLYEVWNPSTSAPAGLADWWAPKDSTITSSVTINNWGDGAAYNVYVYVDANGSTSVLQQRSIKAGTDDQWDEFSPEAKVNAGGDCVIVPSTNDTQCLIAEIPAGGSKTVSFNITKLNFMDARVYPNVYMDWSMRHERNRWEDTPGWNDTNDYNGGRGPASMQLTDGGTVVVKGSAKGPINVAGRSDVPVAFEFANGGPNDVTGGKLRVDADLFDAKGNELSPFSTWYVGDTDAPAEAIKGISLSTGGTCAPATNLVYNFVTNKIDTKTYIGIWDCNGVTIPKGGRITGTVTVNFNTAHGDNSTTGLPVNTGDGERGGFEIDLYTPQFEAPGSNPGAGWSATINRAANADLDITVKSAAAIGAERLGLHLVTVKNNGPSVAKNASMGGSLYKLVGTFEPTLLPGNCTGVVWTNSVSCALGDIASGASVTIAIPVLGPKKVGGTLVATYWTDSWESDTNPDNNDVAHSQMVVKAALAPLEGVKIVKAPAVFKFATLGRTGLKSTVTVPGPSVVTVDITVSRLVAQKMGLIKGGKARAKAPAFIKIGTGKKVMKASGKAVVVTKLTRAYKAKVLKLRKPLKVQRVVTVVSTAALTKGATHMATNNMTLRK